MDKQKDAQITKRLQNLVKKTKTPLIVYKAGSIKHLARATTGSSSSESDYSPSFDDE
jgi:hypothetical protein